MKRKLKVFIRDILNILSRTELKILPGNIAFFALMSIVPLVGLIGSILTRLRVNTKAIIELVSLIVPVDTAMLITDGLSNGNLTVIGTIFFVIMALYVASNLTSSIILASNSIYGFPQTSALERRIKAFVMVFLMIPVVCISIIVPAFEVSVYETLASAPNPISSLETIRMIYQILEVPFGMLLIFINIKILYTVAPDKPVKSSETTSGAIFTTISWYIAVLIYRIYAVSAVGNYSILYGSLANIIILLLWLYILAYLFTIGMGINVVYKNNE